MILQIIYKKEHNTLNISALNMVSILEYKIIQANSSPGLRNLTHGIAELKIMYQTIEKKLTTK
jgi:hypothetical protein